MGSLCAQYDRPPFFPFIFLSPVFQTIANDFHRFYLSDIYKWRENREGSGSEIEKGIELKIMP